MMPIYCAMNNIIVTMRAPLPESPWALRNHRRIVVLLPSAVYVFDLKCMDCFDLSFIWLHLRLAALASVYAAEINAMHTSFFRLLFVGESSCEHVVTVCAPVDWPDERIPVLALCCAGTQLPGGVA
eukprot:1397361-Amphidinium_carterae.2